MPTPNVGSDIEDVCTRCGDGWHVVMAKVGERIAKVVCKRCGSQHAYRGPNAAVVTTASGGRRTVRRKTAKTAEKPPIVAPDFDPNQPPKAYGVGNNYAPGERISHPKFGVGVVAGQPGPGKVEVVFPEGPRTLACARSANKLERPAAHNDAPIGDRPPDAKRN